MSGAPQMHSAGVEINLADGPEAVAMALWTVFMAPIYQVAERMPPDDRARFWLAWIGVQAGSMGADIGHQATANVLQASLAAAQRMAAADPTATATRH